MRYLSIYTGTDDESYFEDIEPPMKSSTPAYNPTLIDSIKRSEAARATGFTFSEYPAGMDWCCHTAPKRQFVIVLEGIAEVSTSKGKKRRLRAGDLLLAEDTTGKGHFAKLIGKKGGRLFVIQLE